MKVAIIGASGKTGFRLVRQPLERAYQVVAICRNTSVRKLDELTDNDGITVISVPVVSDEGALIRALSGCDAVVAVLITVWDLKATELVKSLVKATNVNGVKRLVFTAGEVTTVPEDGEVFTLRQRLLGTLGRLISWITPYSMTDMVKASQLVREQRDCEWTIIRAPTLHEKPALGYQFCEISEVTSAHALSREDYATCLLDSLENTDHHRRVLTVVSGQ